MKKSDVVSHVASSASLSEAESVAAVDAVFEAIQDCLAKGEPVVITGFGTFSTTSRPAPPGAEPEDGREHRHRRLDSALVQGRQDPPRCGALEFRRVAQAGGAIRRQAMLGLESVCSVVLVLIVY